MKNLRELRRLEIQLSKTMRDMAWEAGFRTSKRRMRRFSIRAGGAKIGMVETSIVGPNVVVRILTYASYSDLDGLINFGMFKSKMLQFETPTLETVKSFGLSHTRSVKPCFRSALKIMKHICMLRVMSS